MDKMGHRILEPLRASALQDPRAPALTSPGKAPLSRQRLCDEIERLCNDLRTLKISTADPVALLCDRDPACVPLYLAALESANLVPINPDMRQDEITQLFSRLPVKIILASEQAKAPILESAAATGIQIINFRTSDWSVDLLTRPMAPQSTAASQSLPPEDSALVLQTSGSTDLPRLVPLSAANLVASARNIEKSLELGPNDRCLHTLAMFHVGGIVDVLLAPLFAGGSVVLNRGFDAASFYTSLKEFNATWTQLAPAMLQSAVDYGARHDLDLTQHNLRFIRSVSAPLSEALFHRAKETFNTPIVEIYGMTETAGLIAGNPIHHGQQKPGSVGLPAGPAVRLDENSEILVSGETIMSGYLSADPSSQYTVNFHEKWLRTGDLGHFDKDGYLFITGRVKEIINRGGEKISPAEVDRISLRHPAIADVATYAVPHPQFGEDVAMLLVLDPSENFDLHQFRDFLRAHLLHFKVPNHIHLVGEIPRHRGKLRRAELAKDYPPELTPQQDNEIGAPQSGEEDILRDRMAKIWAKILEVEEVSADDDFFYLGGDSLTATALVNELAETWGETLFISAIFDAPTLTEFVDRLRSDYPDLATKIEA